MTLQRSSVRPPIGRLAVTVCVLAGLLLPGAGLVSAAPGAPRPPVTAEVTATVISGAQIDLRWQNPPGEWLGQIDRVTVQRDRQVITAATGLDIIRTYHVDRTFRPNGGPFRYQVCLTYVAPWGEQCGAEVSATPSPRTPTAPTDLKAERQTLPGGRGANGILLQPHQRVRLTWTNTSVPGAATTIEREDRRARTNTDPASPVGMVSQTVWTEVTRLTAVERHSAEVDVPASPDAASATLQIGKTYRVCAIVPALGPAGRVCSATVTPG